MKKIITFMICTLFLLAVGLCSCSSDDVEEKKEYKYFVGTKLNVKNKEEFPAWVIEKINYLESNETKFLLKKCIYQEETYYWFNIVESSCPMCELYNSEGIQWNEVSNMDIPKEFTKSESDIWEIEYHYPSLQDLFKYFAILE